MDNILSQFALFQNWSPTDLDELLRQGELVTFEPDELVCEQNTVHSDVFFLIQGLMNATMQTGEGTRPFTFGYIKAGSCIGLPALAGQTLLNATVHAVHPSQCWKISTDLLETAMDRHPQAWKTCAQQIALGVAHLLDYIEMLAQPDGYTKLRRLLEKMDEMARECPAFPPAPITQRDLGERIGLSREMVNRMMRALRQGGYIEVDEFGRIRVTKPLPRRF